MLRHVAPFPPLLLCRSSHEWFGRHVKKKGCSKQTGGWCPEMSFNFDSKSTTDVSQRRLQAPPRVQQALVQWLDGKGSRSRSLFTRHWQQVKPFALGTSIDEFIVDQTSSKSRLDVTVDVMREGDLLRGVTLMVDLPGLCTVTQGPVRPSDLVQEGYSVQQLTRDLALSGGMKGPGTKVEVLPASLVDAYRRRGGYGVREPATGEGCSAYVNGVGFMMVERAALLISGFQVDELWAELLYMLNELYGMPLKKLGPEVGLFPTDEERKRWSLAAHRLSIELPFFFTSSPDLHLPLIRLTQHALQVKLSLRRLSDLVYPYYFTRGSRDARGGVRSGYRTTMRIGTGDYIVETRVRARHLTADKVARQNAYSGITRLGPFPAPRDGMHRHGIIPMAGGSNSEWPSVDEAARQIRWKMLYDVVHLGAAERAEIVGRRDYLMLYREHQRIAGFENPLTRHNCLHTDSGSRFNLEARNAIVELMWVMRSRERSNRGRFLDFSGIPDPITGEQYPVIARWNFTIDGYPTSTVRSGDQYLAKQSRRHHDRIPDPNAHIYTTSFSFRPEQDPPTGYLMPENFESRFVDVRLRADAFSDGTLTPHGGPENALVPAAGMVKSVHVPGSGQTLWDLPWAGSDTVSGPRSWTVHEFPLQSNPPRRLPLCKWECEGPMVDGLQKSWNFAVVAMPSGTVLWKGAPTYQKSIREENDTSAAVHAGPTVVWSAERGGDFVREVGHALRYGVSWPGSRHNLFIETSEGIGLPAKSTHLALIVPGHTVLGDMVRGSSLVDLRRVRVRPGVVAMLGPNTPGVTRIPGEGWSVKSIDDSGVSAQAMYDTDENGLGVVQLLPARQQSKNAPAWTALPAGFTESHMSLGTDGTFVNRASYMGRPPLKNDVCPCYIFIGDGVRGADVVYPADRPGDTWGMGESRQVDIAARPLPRTDTRPDAEEWLEQSIHFFRGGTETVTMVLKDVDNHMVGTTMTAKIDPVDLFPQGPVDGWERTRWSRLVRALSDASTGVLDFSKCGNSPSLSFGDSAQIRVVGPLAKRVVNISFEVSEYWVSAVMGINQTHIVGVAPDGTTNFGLPVTQPFPGGEGFISDVMTEAGVTPENYYYPCFVRIKNYRGHDAENANSRLLRLKQALKAVQLDAQMSHHGKMRVVSTTESADPWALWASTDVAGIMSHHDVVRSNLGSSEGEITGGSTEPRHVFGVYAPGGARVVIGPPGGTPVDLMVTGLPSTGVLVLYTELASDALDDSSLQGQAGWGILGKTLAQASLCPDVDTGYCLTMPRHVDPQFSSSLALRPPVSAKGHGLRRRVFRYGARDPTDKTGLPAALDSKLYEIANGTPSGGLEVVISNWEVKTLKIGTLPAMDVGYTFDLRFRDGSGTYRAIRPGHVNNSGHGFAFRVNGKTYTNTNDTSSGIDVSACNEASTDAFRCEIQTLDILSPTDNSANVSTKYGATMSYGTATWDPNRLPAGKTVEEALFTDLEYTTFDENRDYGPDLTPTEMQKVVETSATQTVRFDVSTWGLSPGNYVWFSGYYSILTTSKDRSSAYIVTRRDSNGNIHKRPHSYVSGTERVGGGAGYKGRIQLSFWGNDVRDADYGQILHGFPYVDTDGKTLVSVELADYGSVKGGVYPSGVTPQRAYLYTPKRDYDNQLRPITVSRTILETEADAIASAGNRFNVTDGIPLFGSAAVYTPLEVQYFSPNEGDQSWADGTPLASFDFGLGAGKGFDWVETGPKKPGSLVKHDSSDDTDHFIQHPDLCFVLLDTSDPNNQYTPADHDAVQTGLQDVCRVAAGYDLNEILPTLHQDGLPVHLGLMSKHPFPAAQNCEAFWVVADTYDDNSAPRILPTFPASLSSSVQQTLTYSDGIVCGRNAAWDLRTRGATDLADVLFGGPRPHPNISEKMDNNDYGPALGHSELDDFQAGACEEVTFDVTKWGLMSGDTLWFGGAYTNTSSGRNNSSGYIVHRTSANGVELTETLYYQSPSNSRYNENDDSYISISDNGGGGGRALMGIPYENKAGAILTKVKLASIAHVKSLESATPVPSEQVYLYVYDTDYAANLRPITVSRDGVGLPNPENRQNIYDGVPIGQSPGHIDTATGVAEPGMTTLVFDEVLYPGDNTTPGCVVTKVSHVADEAHTGARFRSMIDTTKPDLGDQCRRRAQKCVEWLHETHGDSAHVAMLNEDATNTTMVLHGPGVTPPMGGPTAEAEVSLQNQAWTRGSFVVRTIGDGGGATPKATMAPTDTTPAMPGGGQEDVGERATASMDSLARLEARRSEQRQIDHREDQWEVLMFGTSYNVLSIPSSGPVGKTYAT